MGYTTHPPIQLELPVSESLLGHAPGTSPRHLADVAAEILLWPDLTAVRRGQLKSGLLSVAHAAQVALARQRGERAIPSRRTIDLRSVPCDPAWLNDLIFQVEPAAIGLKHPNSLANAISLLRYALRRCGLLADDLPDLPRDGTWSRLLCMCDKQDALAACGLRHFARWAHQSDIAPSDVTDATLAAFAVFLRTRTLHRDIPGYLRTVARAWNAVGRTACATTATPPVSPPPKVAPPVRLVTCTVPIEQGTAAFQKDVAAYLALMQGATRRESFRTAGTPKPFRPTTLEERTYRIRQAFTGLIRQGRPIGSITSLADLVTPEAFETILMYYWQRGKAAAVAAGRHASLEEAPPEAGRTSTTRAIAKALVHIAKVHVKLPAPQLAQLREMMSDVSPPRQAGITPKNLAGVRQLDDPHKRLLLLTLPATLMERADGLAAQETAETTPGARLRRARIARDAVVIQMLLHIPLREKNLVSLQFGRHLRSDGSASGRITYLSIPGEEMKNGAAYEMSVSPALDATLRRYRQRHQPVFAPAGSPFLFPSDKPGPGHIDTCTLYQHLRRVIEQEVGIVMNPHLFRQVAVRLCLEANPGAQEDARQLLGDKTMGIVLAHYSSLEPAAAGRRHAERLEKLRHGVVTPRKRQEKRQPRRKS